MIARLLYLKCCAIHPTFEMDQDLHERIDTAETDEGPNNPFGCYGKMDLSLVLLNNVG